MPNQDPSGSATQEFRVANRGGKAGNNVLYFRTYDLDLWCVKAIDGVDPGANAERSVKAVDEPVHLHHRHSSTFHFRRIPSL